MVTVTQQAPNRPSDPCDKTIDETLIMSTLSLENIAQPTRLGETHRSSGTPVPLDVLRIVCSHLQRHLSLETLAHIAQGSRTSYAIAIPKLYHTLVFSSANSIGALAIPPPEEGQRTDHKESSGDVATTTPAEAKWTAAELQVALDESKRAGCHPIDLSPAARAIGNLKHVKAMILAEFAPARPVYKYRQVAKLARGLRAELLPHLEYLSVESSVSLALTTEDKKISANQFFRSIRSYARPKHLCVRFGFDTLIDTEASEEESEPRIALKLVLQADVLPVEAAINFHPWSWRDPTGNLSQCLQEFHGLETYTIHDMRLQYTLPKPDIPVSLQPPGYSHYPLDAEFAHQDWGGSPLHARGRTAILDLDSKTRKYLPKLKATGDLPEFMMDRGETDGGLDDFLDKIQVRCVRHQISRVRSDIEPVDVRSRMKFETTEQNKDICLACLG